MSLNVIFLGANAGTFRPGFENYCHTPVIISEIADNDRSPAALQTFSEADVIIGIAWKEADIDLPNLKLFHMAGAGTDAIQFDALPAAAAICNCFGHEPGIAEYVLLAMLRHVLTVEKADPALRQGRWLGSAAAGDAPNEELAGKTVGILGYGGIGKAVARRAKAFDMQVFACNRSPVSDRSHVDRAYGLDARDEFYAACDFVVCCLPHVPETDGFVNEAAFQAMGSRAFVINVGRGPVIDEAALFNALKTKAISGAAIDTWYVYPNAGNPNPLPSSYPFHELDNVVMTPHSSGWTQGTIRRRQIAMAANIDCLVSGEALVNVVRPAQ